MNFLATAFDQITHAKLFLQENVKLYVFQQLVYFVFTLNALKAFAVMLNVKVVENGRS